MLILKKNLDKIFISLALFTIAFSALSLAFSDKSFVLDLFSHYQLQYLIILTLFAITIFFLKRFLVGLLIITYCTFLFLTFIHPISFFEEKMKTEVFFMNTYYKNPKHELILSEILKKSPEIILLVEANEILVKTLEKHLGKPKLHINNQSDSFTLFSNKPIKNIQVHREEKPHFITAEFENYTLIGIHAFDPLTPFKRKQNIKYLNDIKDFIEKLDGNFLLIGDFNNTYFSKTFRKNFKQYFHKNIYTWSTNRPWMLPIDNALSNFEIEISPTKNLNSDHLGLSVSTK